MFARIFRERSLTNLRSRAGDAGPWQGEHNDDKKKGTTNDNVSSGEERGKRLTETSFVASRLTIDAMACC